MREINRGWKGDSNLNCQGEGGMPGGNGQLLKNLQLPPSDRKGDRGKEKKE